MAETKTHPNPAASTVKADATNAHQMALIQRIQSYAGLAFVFASVLAFCGAIYQITRDFGLTFLKDQGDGIVWSKLIAAYPGSVVLIAASIIGAMLGRGLLTKAAQVNSKTISDEDRKLLEPIITAADEKAISQYVRISSLTGNTGFFTKLGFTGMPLVTAALGMALIILAMFPTALASELMDLAKLVIGAFIGSFVQKKVNDGQGDLPEAKF